MSCNNCQMRKVEQHTVSCNNNGKGQCENNCLTNKSNCLSCKNMQYMQNCQCLNDLPLAIAYVPWQKWKNVMCAKDGIEHGTIFADLVLPFHGCNHKFKR